MGDVAGGLADRLIAAAVVITVLTPLVGCAATGDARPVARRATFTYSCCRAADINPVRHPGDVIRLHWQPSPPTPARSQHVVHVRLSASLTGPYASLADLKTARTTRAGVVADPVLVTEQTADAPPVSTLAIPSDAAPGFYTLTTAVTGQGSRTIGRSVIRIVPRSRS